MVKEETKVLKAVGSQHPVVSVLQVDREEDVLQGFLPFPWSPEENELRFFQLCSEAKAFEPGGTICVNG
jgi:hypothetical protein